MNINPLSLNPDHFSVKDCMVAGDPCWLINPSKAGTEWTKDNLVFRSVILRQSDLKIVSAGHKKWFNYGESPALYPNPLGFKDARLFNKLDGSLIIVSRHNGELVVRTRGTVDVSVHDTGAEIMGLIKKYGIDTYDIDGDSFLFEHTTPNNRIVLAYPEPELTLLDIICHDDYSYYSSQYVDTVAHDIGCPRPESFLFSDLDEVAAACKTLTDQEGFVLSYGANQHRVKIKTDDYLLKHRFKANATLSNILDIFVAAGCPEPTAFQTLVVNQYDWECFKMAQPHILEINTAYRRVTYNLRDLYRDAQDMLSLPRRDAAMKIKAKYVPEYQSVMFGYLDGKEPAPKKMRDLIESEVDKVGKIVQG